MEIYSLVYDELRKIDRAGMLPAGAIITGGGAKLPGIVDLAKNTLGLPAQVGFPMEVDGMNTKVDDPTFACAVGLIVWGSKTSSNIYTLGNLNLSDTFSGVGNWVKSWFS
jgi:cell division protein FtsA